MASDATFVGDYSTGDFSQWESLQAVAGRATVVTTPAKAGENYVGRFEVRAGDVEPITSANRCEVLHPWSSTTKLFVEGEEHYFGWATYLDPTFPQERDLAHILSQWKQGGTGAPPIWFTAQWNKFTFSRGTDPVIDYYVGPITRGQWVCWVLRVRFSSDPTIGFIELWRDGIPQVLVNGGLRCYGATLVAGLDSYWKQGVYRDPAHTLTAIGYHAGSNWGPSYASVAPIIETIPQYSTPRRQRANRPGRKR
jgi:hypothetical protein